MRPSLSSRHLASSALFALVLGVGASTGPIALVAANARLAVRERQAAEAQRVTRDVTVTAAGRSRTIALAELQALPKATLNRLVVTGARRGTIGPFTWTGAALADVLKLVDPTIADARHAGSTIVLTSSDGWKAYLSWEELFSHVSTGAALYNIKGCNECHGMKAEGTAPPGKRPAPALKGRRLDESAALDRLRKGGEAHAAINAYTEAQLTRSELEAILSTLAGTPTAAASAPYQPPADRRGVLLAYEKDGRPATGADGLIQLVVGPDEAASRYGHWVQATEVLPPSR